MKNRLLIFFFLLLSYKGFSQCVLDATITQSSVVICSGSVATLTANGGDSYVWYDAQTGGNVVSTSITYVTPVLNNTTKYYVVVTSGGCSSSRLPVTAIVTQTPPAPTASNAAICAGSVANLHADGPPGVFNWYTTPTGGQSLISSPDYTTPPLTATTTYYVEEGSFGCEGPRTAVTVNVTPLPNAPDIQTDVTCYGTSITLTASANPSGTYQWYDALAGGNLLATGNNFTTPALTNSTTYYVQGVNGACASARLPINVIVKPPLTPPSAAGLIACSGSVSTLTASSPGGTYQWYDAAIGGNLLSTAATYATPALTATTTYYVQNTYDGCVSQRTAVTVTIQPSVTPPTAANASVCSGSMATLTALGSTGSYAWYDAPTGGNLLSSSQVYVTPALTATTTYYVETIVNGCASTATAVTVTVTPLPDAPTASGTTVCPGTSASLTANTGGATALWYNAASGGNLIATGSPFNTPALTATTTYYVAVQNGDCASSRTAVTVNVTSVVNPSFQYTSGTYCTSGTDPTPKINVPGGTFSATPMGLIIDPNTGEITIATSQPGNYTISYSTGGTCPSTSTAALTVTIQPNASFSYPNSPFCQDGANPTPTFATMASGGTFTSTPSGLVFANTSTGEINLAASQPGTYTITNTIKATGGCPAASATSQVTIAEKVTVSAGPDQSVPVGGSVQLAGSISGGATTGTWSASSGAFSNTSTLNPTYTPSATSGTVVLTLTSANPQAPCGPQSSQLTITINSQSAAPVAQGATICAGSSATLTATSPGGSYGWYDAFTDGNLLFTGATYITPVLNVTTTYYVQTTLNGFTSARTAVTVIVNAFPANPVVGPTQICSGSMATLTANGSIGTYQWYDAATGGNLLATGDTYTTTVLTANVTYYVQANNNGCISNRVAVPITVSPVPNVTSAATANVCSGNALSYNITADQQGTTFIWNRAAVDGVSNPPASNQTSSSINETLINTTLNAINVNYVITPMLGNCPGPAFNYMVTVYPTPVVTSATNDTICSITATGYQITFSTPNTAFYWGRAAVPGIENAAVSGQGASTIQEVLFNTTSVPINVTYLINYATITCTGATFSYVVTVNPTTSVTSPITETVCNATPQNYQITANVPSATFNWYRVAVPGISNPAVTNQTSSIINEALINTTDKSITLNYQITPIAYGCSGVTYPYAVTVKPQLAAPVAMANSPLCTGATVHLTANTIANATYLWTGPNGFTSTLQNPDIPGVTSKNTGNYFVTVLVDGCTSTPDTVSVAIDQPPTANAGANQQVCIADTAVFLLGAISGNTTGVWSTNGSGTFSPSATNLSARYLPSAADKAAGSIVLTLTSTNTDGCTISSSSITISFGPLPAANAGPDQDVCSQETNVQLGGKILVGNIGSWSTSGSGTFTPSDTVANAIYIPSIADIKSGSVLLTLTATGIPSGPCYIQADEVKIKFTPPPTVNAGGTVYVLKGNSITLNPTVSEDNIHYLWLPNVDLSNDTVKNPVVNATANITYTLQVTDSRGCITESKTEVVVEPPIQIFNTFTPNGDGVNDYWDIPGLIVYSQATVDIFDRYGQKVFHSVGYGKPWDGTYNGKPLPVGTYYYIINNKPFDKLLSGYVTLIR